ncbi:hypothetical protein VIBNIWn13_680005 [Vibrio nigripulchritudo Wn13]|nr:hypothetical protein VIBNISFn118_1320037 [Vibrio nigripulchritudo SFn118]CCN93422.1 hypothetical protein VIBNIENn2_220005 [Vibrio nigripulchritudo ENn2]CCO54395.1 hypothetical protein VIBNIWn13_680005 [Vibrio nigripulchritudo Wn13]
MKRVGDNQTPKIKLASHLEGDVIKKPRMVKGANYKFCQ